jgi:hypothetical protein
MGIDENAPRKNASTKGKSSTTTAPAAKSQGPSIKNFFKVIDAGHKPSVK